MNIRNLLKMTQNELKKFLPKYLKKYGYEPIVKDGFIYARGTNVEVCVVAHMDTTPYIDGRTRKRVKQIFTQDGVMWSPQGIGGDDRNGIFSILRILETTQLRPTILFTEDEEIGCVGSTKFIQTDYIYELSLLKFIVQIDRRGRNDLVFYQDDNKAWHKWVEKITGWKTKIGSYTDICEISPICGVASVNISCGYYDEHTKFETIVLSEVYGTIKCLKKLLRASFDSDAFYYKEKEIIRYGSKCRNYVFDEDNTLAWFRDNCTGFPDIERCDSGFWFGLEGSTEADYDK